MAKIVVLGSNFAGLSAALETRRKLGTDHEVVVVSPSRKFLYVPSLIWVPFGSRKIEDITFDVGPVLDKHGIRFINDRAVKVVPDRNLVVTGASGDLSYDYLVCATGVGLNFDILPHLDPRDGYVHSIVTPPQAEQAHRGFERLVDHPGPVIVGATQGASCMGAAYEYLFNLDKELRKRGVRKKIDITWITPEPFLGHFGIGGMRGGQRMLELFMKMYGIRWHVNSIIEEIGRDRLLLQDGTELPYAFAMLIPPFVGADVMRSSPELVDEKGFVPCNDGYQHVTYKNVFAAGLAVQVVSPFVCAAPFGVPKTGFPSDVQGKIVAENIANAVKETGKFKTLPFGKIPGLCIMDAGSKEVWILASSLFKPRAFEIMVPNVVYDFGKILLEKYMLMKNRHGWAYLP